MIKKKFDLKTWEHIESNEIVVANTHMIMIYIIQETMNDHIEDDTIGILFFRRSAEKEIIRD